MFASSLQNAIQSGLRERRLTSPASSDCSSSSSSSSSEHSRGSMFSSSSSSSSSSSFYQAASQSGFNPNFSRSDPVERLKTYVPKLPDDRQSLQLLVESVSDVMKLESQLFHLDNKMQTYRNGLHSVTGIPDDLENVDVSAFKHLVGNQPVDNKMLL